MAPDADAGKSRGNRSDPFAPLTSEQFAAFSPDTLAEARNRGYHPHASARDLD